VIPLKRRYETNTACFFKGLPEVKTSKLVTANKLSPKAGPWGAKDCSGNPADPRGGVEELERKAWFFAASRQKMRTDFLNLLTVPNWLQFGGFPDFGRYFLKL
jgi:hypothetical protein